MSTCLDPDVLERRAYSGDVAFRAYQEFVRTGTEEDRLGAWDTAIPLIPTRYRRSKFYRRGVMNRAEADDLYSAMGWKVWNDLPKIRKRASVGSPGHYTNYLHGVLRFGFYTGVQEMNRGFVQEIPLEAESFYEWRYDRSFTDLDNRLYLQDLPRIAERWLMCECETRFDDRFKRAARFCLRLKFRRQAPLPMVVQDVWGVEDADFVWDWTTVKLRQFMSGQREIFRSASSEDLFDHVFS